MELDGFYVFTWVNTNTFILCNNYISNSTLVVIIEHKCWQMTVNDANFVLILLYIALNLKYIDMCNNKSQHIMPFFHDSNKMADHIY